MDYKINKCDACDKYFPILWKDSEYKCPYCVDRERNFFMDLATKRAEELRSMVRQLETRTPVDWYERKPIVLSRVSIEKPKEDNKDSKNRVIVI